MLTFWACTSVVMGFDRIQRKKRAIQLLPSPSSLKELRGALGSLSCFRRFIPNFADTAKPLHRLLEKQVDHRQFVWSSECETAFQQLKQCLCQAPTLAFPNLNEQFTTDEQGDRPIAFFSRTLNKAEQNYPTHERASSYCECGKTFSALFTRKIHY